jgi:hypothetical protein
VVEEFARKISWPCLAASQFGISSIDTRANFRVEEHL